MSAAVLRTVWHQGTPPAGKVVEVWYFVSVILATWNGDEWRTVDGQRLEGVSRWRHRQ